VGLVGLGGLGGGVLYYTGKKHITILIKVPQKSYFYGSFDMVGTGIEKSLI